ncbi:MAG: DUF397 domain-containing protein [Actinobacteria bacterium]|nr:DUF397 domain-containing protein [Actinomycetota bacterium]
MEGTDHTLTTWRKSTFSGGNGSDCVEVGRDERAVVVRDTKNRTGAVLMFGPDAWRRFAATVKNAGKG